MDANPLRLLPFILCSAARTKRGSRRLRSDPAAPHTRSVALRCRDRSFKFACNLVGPSRLQDGN
eukprot:3823527-Amphidinium_carterae.2